MTNRTRSGLVLLLLAQGLAGCGRSTTPNPTAPTGPTVAPAPTPSPTPPPNGELIQGSVSDTAFRPLAGTTVEVLDGPQAGTSTTSDATGHFSLTGTFDDTTRFRATKEGHAAATGTLRPTCARCDPRWWIQFTLEVLAPPVNMAGDYTLTFIADSACVDLPNEVRTRTYAATITPGSANTNFQVALSGASFFPSPGSFPSHGSFPIGVAGNYVGFWFADPALVEEIAANTYVVLYGAAGASVGASGMSTIAVSWDGSFEYCAGKSTMGQSGDCSSIQTVAQAECESKNHQLILTRR